MTFKPVIADYDLSHPLLLLRLDEKFSIFVTLHLIKVLKKTGQGSHK